MRQYKRTASLRAIAIFAIRRSRRIAKCTHLRRQSGLYRTAVALFADVLPAGLESSQGMSPT
jgi:hypothetical protein